MTTRAAESEQRWSDASPGVPARQRHRPERGSNGVVRRLTRRALPDPAARAFARWAAGAYAATTTALLLAILRRTDGRLVYVLDDPAIHMAMARTLAEHGTWGIEPGHFQSASSSPLWTVLLAGLHVVAPWLDTAAPLLLNVAAALATVVLLAGPQRTFRPSRRRPLDVLAVTLLTVVVLFLPAATFIGMEHLLHTALALATTRLVLRAPDPTRGRASRAAPYACMALATLTRFETAFLAAGLGIGLLATVDLRSSSRATLLRRRLGHVVLLGLSSAVPLAGFMAFNRAMGQGWLPNSVVAKSSALTGGRAVPPLRITLNTLVSDAVLGVLVFGCVVAVLVAWPTRPRPRWLVAGVGVPITALLHSAFADVGWYERYQVYLVALCVLTLLLAARDLLPAADADALPLTTADGATSRPPRLAPMLVVVLMLFGATKASLTYEVPNGAADTFEQRYQAARFLARYYDGRPVATGELGYVSLFHDGPITDLYGLGDHEVLRARIDIPASERSAYWRDLAAGRGVAVVAAYPRTLGFDTPSEWVRVGTWTLTRPRVSAFEQTFHLWATRPEEVAPLIDHLIEFEADLPDGVEQEINEWAQMRADDLMAGDRPG